MYIYYSCWTIISWLYMYNLSRLGQICHDLALVCPGGAGISEGHFAHELMDSWMPMDAMVNPWGSRKKIQVLVIFHYCPLVNKQFTSLLWKITTMFFLWGFIHYFDWAICSSPQTVNVDQARFLAKNSGFNPSTSSKVGDEHGSTRRNIRTQSRMSWTWNWHVPKHVLTMSIFRKPKNFSWFSAELRSGFLAIWTIPMFDVF